MSTSPNSAVQQQVSVPLRLRNYAIGSLFALVLLVPKLLLIRRDPRAWTTFRVLLGIAGAALVILPLSLWNSWLAAIAGLALFLFASLMPSARPNQDLDAKTHELGALVVVNGGSYRGPGGAEIPVKLFAGPQTISLLDSQLQCRLTLGTPQISSVQVGEVEGTWVLRIRCGDRAEDLSYRGVFAEHFARVAESTLLSLIPATLPMLPMRRSATA
jgi:hypothetical protein